MWQKKDRRNDLSEQRHSGVGATLYKGPRCFSSGLGEMERNVWQLEICERHQFC